jgi:RNA-directed DNA polymerase
MSRVSRKIHDKRVLHLIGKFLRAGVVVEGRLQRSREGVPQGGPLSPVLANVVLDDLDKELERRGHRFSRYADDFIILVKSLRAGERVMGSIRRYLETKLKLKVNEEKSQVVKSTQLEFLSFAFRGSRIVWSPKALHVFKYRIRKLTGRSWGVSMKWRLFKLAQYMRGWMGYFGISKTYKLIRQMDHWIRRRIRCCYWKQWKTIRNRTRNLLKLGINRRNAILHGSSGNGCWHMSKTPTVNEALSNQWLSEKGLLSLTTLWITIHYPTTVR